MGTPQVTDLLSLRPLCSLCFNPFTANSPLFQLGCKHILCQNCIQECVSGQMYCCPFDGSTSTCGALDQQVVQNVEWAVANGQQAGHPTYAQFVITLFQTLQNTVNYQRVPCRSYASSRLCQSRSCPYDHNDLSIMSRQCPWGNTCYRRQFCPYGHMPIQAPQNMMFPGTPQTPPNFPFPGTPQMPSNYPTVGNPQIGFQNQMISPAYQQFAPTYNAQPGYQSPGVVQQAPHKQRKHGPKPPNQSQNPIQGPQMQVPIAPQMQVPIAPQQTSSNSPLTYHHMPHWYAQQADSPPTLAILKTTDKRYKEVADFFHQTSPTITIVSIQRIQSKRLYTNFAFKHEGFSQMEGRPVAIKRLFHGTGATDPSIIYSSDTGLDSRLGKGMWGMGTYYAQNSSYSAPTYAFTRPDGSKQLFCCNVIVGDFIQLAPDNTLTRPPQKQGGVGCYHSVKGHTGGSDVFITYEPAMSYPYFLITFK